MFIKPKLPNKLCYEYLFFNKNSQFFFVAFDVFISFVFIYFVLKTKKNLFFFFSVSDINLIESQQEIVNDYSNVFIFREKKIKLIYFPKIKNSWHRSLFDDEHFSEQCISFTSFFPTDIMISTCQPSIFNVVVSMFCAVECILSIAPYRNGFNMLSLRIFRRPFSTVQFNYFLFRKKPWR